MPKETIYPGSPDPRGTTKITVGWGRNSYAQIGIQRESLGATESAAWSDNLSRADINDLIRVLRKARDQVHGRDE